MGIGNLSERLSGTWLIAVITVANAWWVALVLTATGLFWVTRDD